MTARTDTLPEKARRRRRWGRFLLAVGLLGLLLSVAIAGRQLALLAVAQSAPGTVIEMVRMASGRLSAADAYAPRVRFVLDAVEHEFVSPVGSYPPAFQIGDTVRVLYDPANPRRAMVDSSGQLWAPVAVCAVLGLLLGGLGAWLLRKSRVA